MRRFAALFEALDRTTRTAEKVAALEDYFRSAPPADAAWALHFLAGNRLKRAIPVRVLRECAAEAAGIPPWLLDECYETVGDLGETLALLLPAPVRPSSLTLSVFVAERLLPMAAATEARQRQLLRGTWSELDTVQRFLWHKMLTGNFRVGVSRALLVRALASVAGVDPAVLSHRLMGDWQPSAEEFIHLLREEHLDAEPAKPYPFCLASPLEQEPASLGEARNWQVEWKWDGIRAQLIRRSGEIVVWSRGEEIITPAFPEVALAARTLPDGTVLDGELLAWEGDAPAPFHRLQRRLNRRSATAALQQEVPVIFMAYDVLEQAGVDARLRTLEDRRRLLEELVRGAGTEVQPSPMRARWVPEPSASMMLQDELFQEAEWSTPATRPSNLPDLPRLRVSPVLEIHRWEDLVALQDRARATGVEGVMLKRRDSTYGVGRQRGAWWKWKVAPYQCDAVLIAAQPGHGRRATLFTDYTFGLWDGPDLVPVAKAYSGLTDEEIDSVDAFVRRHTTGRFGPVRTVQPELVFELAFEGIAVSSRHRSGIALRFPRIARWHHDKKPAEADTVESVRKLMGPAGKT